MTTITITAPKYTLQSIHDIDAGQGVIYRPISHIMYRTPGVDGGYGGVYCIWILFTRIPWQRFEVLPYAPPPGSTHKVTSGSTGEIYMSVSLSVYLYVCVSVSVCVSEYI